MAPRRPTRAPFDGRINSSVRIIGGIWKRTPLKIPPASDLRPTPDRVRETVFNWLSHQLAGSLEGLSVLDLFAGSGALGFEAASRGAKRVVLVDSNPAVVMELKAAKERLKADMIEIIRSDAFSMAAGFASRISRESARASANTDALRASFPTDIFDVVFIDPPYGQGLLERMLPIVPSLLNERGLVYAEAEAPVDETVLNGAGLETLRADKAGRVHYHLLRLKNKTPAGQQPMATAQ